jgi:hypothetical protein
MDAAGKAEVLVIPPRTFTPVRQDSICPTMNRGQIVSTSVIGSAGSADCSTETISC